MKEVFCWCALLAGDLWQHDITTLVSLQTDVSQLVLNGNVTKSVTLVKSESGHCDFSIS